MRNRSGELQKGDKIVNSSTKIYRGYDMFSLLQEVSEDRDFNLFWLIIQTSRLLIKARDTELSNCQLSHIQAGVLFLVQHLDKKATPSEIARWLNREPHSISEAVSIMERRGLVGKVRDLNPKNQVRVILTKEGQQAFDCSTIRQSIHRVISCLSEEERQQMWSCLSKLRDKVLEDL